MFSKSFSGIGERIKRLIGRGSAWFIVLFVLLTLVANFVVSSVVTLLHPHSQGSFMKTLNYEWWYSTNLTFFDGFGPSSFIGRLFVPFTLLFFYAIPSIIFSFVNNLLERFQERMRKGQSPITGSGHTLILGWSDRIYSIIRELEIANENNSGAKIVVFCTKDAVDMDDAFKTRLENIKQTKLLTRNGDPTSIYDLRRANVSGAKNIIILDEDPESDATVINTILAIQALDPKSMVPIVAEMDSDLYSEAMKSISQRTISFVRSEKIITTVTVQSARSAGMTPVLLDLLDFDGDEIYFQEVAELVGKSYGDSLTAFNKAAVIGVIDGKGTVFINPAIERVMQSGEKVIAIASDDDQIIFSGLNTEFDSLKSQSEDTSGRTDGEPQNVLVLGWSEMGHDVIQEMAPFLPSGSLVQIIADSQLSDIGGLDINSIPGLMIEIVEAPRNLGELKKYLNLRRYEKVIVLAYRGIVTRHDADARTLASILVLNRFFADAVHAGPPPRIIAEVLNSDNVALTEIASADDLVVSDNLAALLIAQLSENADLFPIFETLFDKDGAPININPLENYVAEGVQVTFQELVARAAARGESAIGYRVEAHSRSDSSAGVRLNPAKSDIFQVAKGDGLIVIG
jgi:K+/H+ antiporter YhaU regulatory subunit KhtT